MKWLLLVSLFLGACGPSEGAGQTSIVETEVARPTKTSLPQTETPQPMATNTPTETPSPTETSAPTDTPEEIVGYDGCEIGSPPPALNVDAFYAKYCDAGGIPVLSSANVPDLALQQAWNIIMNMLAARPDLHEMIAANGTLFGIIGVDEVTTDMPEYRDLNELWPETNWDARTRGLGATTFKRLSSAAEENLLCYSRDIYWGENITVHEFAHTIHTMGLEFIERDFNSRLAALYNEAKAVGLWTNTYAGSNVEEYWAEGVQSYFNSNLQAYPANGVHNYVDTREELQEYDVGLYDLIATVFPTYVWTPACPLES